MQVSELKRINNLIKDQDFYALRVIKVPARRHGVLSHLINRDPVLDGKPAGAHNFQNGRTRPSDSDLPSDACSDVDFSDPDTQLRVIQKVSIRQNFSKQGREAERFLRKMDKDLSKFRDSAHTGDRESLGEVISMLTNKSFQPLHGKRELVNGWDCGIRWWWYLVAVVIVAVLFPAVYIIYKLFIEDNHGS